MAQHPVSAEVGAALGAFFTGGSGLRHTVLSRVFNMAGYGDAAPYDPQSPPGSQLNKEERIRRTIAAAVSRPSRSRELVDGLLGEMRVSYCFQDPDNRPRLDALKAAFARIDWQLTNDGELIPGFSATVSSATGRPAIEEQLARLRKAPDDPGLSLGTAKELLESTAKYVLEAFSVPYSGSMSFDELWFHARDKLGLNPKDVEQTQPGARHVQQILQASWDIARVTNDLRRLQGTGHGRTLPTGVTPEMALIVVREACSVAEFVLATLDRKLGRLPPS